MADFVSLGVWGVLVAAPCIMSWLLGEMYGAARTRRLFEDACADVISTEIPIAPVLKKPAELSATRANRISDPAKPRVSSEKHGTKLSTMRDPMAYISSEAWQHSATDTASEHAQRRKETFADMPSLEELGAETFSIRSSECVWDDLRSIGTQSEASEAAQRVLAHYRGSISELAHTSGADVPIKAETLEVELPRFAGAAPISPDGRSRRGRRYDPELLSALG